MARYARVSTAVRTDDGIRTSTIHSTPCRSQRVVMTHSHSNPSRQRGWIRTRPRKVSRTGASKGDDSPRRRAKYEASRVNAPYIQDVTLRSLQRRGRTLLFVCSRLLCPSWVGLSAFRRQPLGTFSARHRPWDDLNLPV